VSYVVLGILGSPDYVLVAIGFVFIFSVVKAYPFHQGAVLLLASYTFLFAYQQLSSIVLAALVLIAAMTALSLLTSRLAFEPLLGRHFPSLIVAFGILTIIQETAAQYFYEGQAVAYPPSLKVGGTFPVGDVQIGYDRLLSFGAGLLMVVALDQFFRRTRPGMRMRAVSDSPVGAELCGVDNRWAIRGAFVLAGIAAAAGGVLLGVEQSTISPSLASSITINGLAAALLGGSTSLRGAVAAAVLISVIDSVAIGYISSSFSEAITFVAIIAVLILRPHGILGSPEVARA
jgi:branched-chain amino acid transport system permease protein